MQLKDLLTIREAAASLGIAESTMRTATLEGRIPFVVVLNRKLLRKRDLDAYRARTQPTGEKLRGRPRKAGGQRTQ